MNIPEEFINHSYDYFYEKVVSENKNTYDKYNSGYETIKNRHPVFGSNWSGNFFSSVRYMNWVIYAFITEFISKDKTIFDIGCYDGVLVKILCDQGYNTYGWNFNGYKASELDWPEMYNYLGVRDRIQTKFDEDIDIVIMFDYHHNYHPDNLFPAIKKSCFGSLPKTIFFDREYGTGLYNKLYYDESVLDGLKINQLVSFPKAGIREMMIWENEK